MYEYACGCRTKRQEGHRTKYAQENTYACSYQINVEGFESQTRNKNYTGVCVAHPMGTGPASSLMTE